MRCILSLIFSAVLFVQANSQSFYYNDRYFDRDLIFEFGGGLGAMNSITDVGGSKGKGGFYVNDMNLKYTQLSSSVYFGFLYQQLIGARVEATWGSVKGADSILDGTTNPNTMLRYNRNMNFKSSINEIAILAEFHPLSLWPREEPKLLSPYVLAGLGWFRFNPQVSLNGRYVDINPLSLEGQGFPEFKDRPKEHLKQANVPVGLGLKYELNQLFSFRLEAVHRFLFTDYLDGVSATYINRDLFAQYLPAMQAANANAIYDLKRDTPAVAGKPRGNAGSKDSYLSLSLKVGVTLGRQRRD